MITPWLASVWRESVPATGHRSAVEWCEANVRLIGSARSEKFDASLTPWTREPLESACSGECSVVTFVKPVQSGGSAAGECAVCYWLGTETGGDIQYNWEDDRKAGERWEKRIEKILKACQAVMDRAPSQDRQDGRWKKRAVIFAHCNFTVQGVFTEDNLDSDTIRFQVNEEVHSWEQGRLQKAYNRTSAVWNSVRLNISNASYKDDQLHEASRSGTDQVWEVPCPTCGKYHAMRTKWEDDKPELGGLRYDSEGCRSPDGSYDYNKLGPTIRYQFPCGHQMKDDPVARRQMSLQGRYSESRNKGALPSERSYSLDGVSVDYIRWVTIVQKKHQAIRALHRGDPKPFTQYTQEVECRFWDSKDRPTLGNVILSPRLRKDRGGLPDRVARFGTLDYQQGKISEGELPHWWALILDVNNSGVLRVVYEGKLLTDEDASDVMERHEVHPTCVAVDSGHAARHVYQFCLKHGYNAIKGAPDIDFAHPKSGRKIFSPEKPLHTMLNLPPTKEDPAEEPLFWHYSKPGIRERLKYIRASPDYKLEIPEDVSKDFLEHMEAEEEQERRHTRTNELIVEWVQVKDRNDLFVLLCYSVMLAEMAGLVGVDVAK